MKIVSALAKHIKHGNVSTRLAEILDAVHGTGAVLVRSIPNVHDGYTQEGVELPQEEITPKTEGVAA